MFRAWRVAVLVAAIVAAFANSTSGPFILDDQASVVQNSDIRDLRRLDRVLTPRPDSPVAGRPLVNLTLAIDYAVGGLDVTGYHVVNIAWHLVCALLLFGVLRRTLARPEVRERVPFAPENLACAATLLWAVHPLTTEVVVYITQRTESMMAACLLLTLYAAIRAAESPTTRWHAVAIVACLAGTVCKETIAVAPLLVVLYDRAFLFASWSDAWRMRARLYLGLSAMWLVLGGLVASGPRAAVGGLQAGVSVWTYVLNQAQVIADYAGLVFWPVGLVTFYGWPEPLALTDVAWQAALVSALVLLTGVAWVRAPRVGFAGVWVWLTLAPTSSVIPIATEVGAERRMYLPLMAIAVLVVVAVAKVVARAMRRHDVRTQVAVGVLLLAAATAALAATTIARNREYGSAVTLARTIVERRPTPVAHHFLGEQLMLMGEMAEAEQELRAAVQAGNTRAAYPLGMVQFQAGRLTDAAASLQAFVATASVPQRFRWLEPPLPELLPAWLVLAQIHAVERRWPDAAADARRVLAAAPRHPEAQKILGLALFNQRAWPDAIAVYREYLVTRPADAQARLNYGVALIASERLPEAVAEFRRAVELEPANPEARRLLDLALADQRAAQ